MILQFLPFDSITEITCLPSVTKWKVAEPGFEPRENDRGERQSSWAWSWKQAMQEEGGGGPLAFGTLLSWFSLEPPRQNKYSKDALQILRKTAGNGGDRLS